VLGQLQQHHWGDHDVFSIHLALEEALVNAIKHGNGLDLAKQVRVRCRMSDDLVQIEIADEGEGFDPRCVPDPTDEHHRECPNGRGVMLMRSFMDRVQYNERGNCVLLEKRRTKPE
jgi:serine/threonine-protein kinase RsbW